MKNIEKIVREKLGQKKFNPINEQKHKRFNFSKDCTKNKNIIELFNEYGFCYDNYSDSDDKIYDTFDNSGLLLNFYKGGCRLLIEILNEDADWYTSVESMYSTIIIEDYSGLGTVEIIISILEKYSNFIEINRDNKIEKILN